LTASVVAAGGLSLWGGQSPVVLAQSPVPPTAHNQYSVEPRTAERQAVRMRFAPDELEVLALLNRADPEQLSTFDALVVPSSWHSKTMAYSPFPAEYPAWGAELLKLLIVHQPSQAFAAYEAGRLIRWGPVSSGRRQSQTPAGLFHLTWRSLDWLGRGIELPVNPVLSQQPCLG
jgi:hypothetical protein